MKMVTKISPPTRITTASATEMCSNQLIEMYLSDIKFFDWNSDSLQYFERDGIKLGMRC